MTGRENTSWIGKNYYVLFFVFCGDFIQPCCFFCSFTCRCTKPLDSTCKTCKTGGLKFVRYLQLGLGTHPGKNGFTASKIWISEASGCSCTAPALHSPGAPACSTSPHASIVFFRAAARESKEARVDLPLRAWGQNDDFNHSEHSLQDSHESHRLGCQR